jgi:hypothetical protein
MFLTHYYHKQDKPFQSLSALEEAESLIETALINIPTAIF